MTLMASVPVAGTLPERELIAAIRRVTGTEPQAQVAGLPGTPDAVVPDKCIAAFAMGCFWHNHPGCSLARIPQTAFDWEGKMARNRQRDARVRAELITRGYRVIWVWECAVRGAGALSRSELDAAVADFIGSAGTFAEIEGRKVPHRRMARAG